jgi:magnesium-transporting ATPase (P-type)
VVARRQPDGRLVLYCKGADSVIAPRAARERNEFVAATMQHAELFSRTGLRTLVSAPNREPTHEGCGCTSEQAQTQYYRAGAW